MSLSFNRDDRYDRYGGYGRYESSGIYIPEYIKENEIIKDISIFIGSPIDKPHSTSCCKYCGRRSCDSSCRYKERYNYHY